MGILGIIYAQHPYPPFAGELSDKGWGLIVSSLLDCVTSLVSLQRGTSTVGWPRDFALLDLIRISSALGSNERNTSRGSARLFHTCLLQQFCWSLDPVPSNVVRLLVSDGVFSSTVRLIKKAGTESGMIGYFPEVSFPDAMSVLWDILLEAVEKGAEADKVMVQEALCASRAVETIGEWCLGLTQESLEDERT